MPKITTVLILLTTLFTLGNKFSLAQTTPERLLLGHIGVTDSAHKMAAAALIREIECRLPGRFSIEDKGGSTLGGEADIWEGIQLGTIDLAVLTTAAITPYVPQLGILSIPFLFRDTDHVAQVLNGSLGDELGASLAEQAAAFLGFAEHGFRHLSNSQRPIRHPTDLAGLRIRVIPNSIYERTFKALGAEVVPMAWPAVYGALEDGRIDGQENPLLSFFASRLERVQKYLYFNRTHLLRPHSRCQCGALSATHPRRTCSISCSRTPSRLGNPPSFGIS